MEVRDDAPDRVAPDMPEPASFLTRLIDIHLAPERALRVVAAFPRTWWQPTLFLIILGAVAIYLTMDRLIVPEMINSMVEQGLSDEQIDDSLPVMKFIPWAALILVPLQILVIALVAHLCANLLLGGVGAYLGAVSVVAHSLLIGVVEALVRVPLMLAKESLEVYLGPALLLPADMQETLLFRVIAQFDIFTIWKVLLIGLGLAIVYRLAPRRAIAMMVVLWLIWVLATALLGGLAPGGAGV